MRLSAQSVQYNLPEISGKNKGLNTCKMQFYKNIAGKFVSVTIILIIYPFIRDRRKIAADIIFY